MHYVSYKDVSNKENKCTTAKLLTYHREDNLSHFFMDWKSRKEQE